MPPEKPATTSTFKVYVHDQRVVAYLVDAKNAEEAREKVERSVNVDLEFDRTTEDTKWYVDQVEKV